MLAWACKGIEIQKLYDLGKFCFTAGTATLAFLAAAEKVNTPSAWKSDLIVAAAALGFATLVAVFMVIAGAPYAKANLVDSRWPTVTVFVWFLLWAFGAGWGLNAVIPHPN